MKLGKLGWILSVAALALVGCDSSEEADAPEEEAVEAVEGEAAAEGEGKEGEAADGDAAEAEAKEEAPGPAVACAALIEAFKGKDGEAVAGMSTEGAAEAFNAKVLEMMATQMAEATCGEESVDGDTAKVKVTAGKDERNITFTKVEDAWKFDHAAYTKDYPAPAPQKGKKKKRKKKKRKKK